MAYASPNDLISRYDIDVIGMLASDDREEVERVMVPLLPNVATALDDASGEIDVKLLAGGRYKPEQLAALTGNSLNHLKRITCAIAMAFLFDRRTEGAYADLAEKVSKVQRESLTQLAKGENVFGIPEQENGKAATIDVDTVEAIDIENLNLMPARMPRFFPGSAQRTPRF